MRYSFVPEASRAWILGRSTLHPIEHDTAGLEGWIELIDADGAPAFAEGGAAHVELPVARLRSGNPLQDRELRRRIDAGRHRHITGDVVSASTTAPGVAQVTGDITFMGVARPHTGELRLTRDGDDVVIDGSATFDVREFGMKPPKILLIQVEPEVTVRIEVRARPAT